MADMTHDAADDGFHEIQLSGKQLVALFMGTTVVSVLIFLCGVMVGRGVNTDRPSSAVADASITTPARNTALPAEQPAPQAVATPAEPPSPPPGDELSYRRRLESEGSAADDRLKPAATAGRPDDRSAAKLETAKPEAPRPADPAPASIAKTPAAAAPQAGRPGRWVLQLVALRDRGAASSIVQRLSSKGYPAFMVNPAASASGPNKVYKVQVGRYDDKSEAERVSRRLEKEEKFHPWISR